LFDVRTMEERLDRSLVQRRMPMGIALAFGLVALFLAGIGVYGVLACQVTERRAGDRHPDSARQLRRGCLQLR
jgi:hypothetical protein